LPKLLKYSQLVFISHKPARYRKRLRSFCCLWCNLPNCNRGTWKSSQLFSNSFDMIAIVYLRRFIKRSKQTIEDIRYKAAGFVQESWIKAPYLFMNSFASVCVDTGKTNKEFLESSPDSLRRDASRSSIAGSSRKA
jgi:hypothetical protein